MEKEAIVEGNHFFCNDQFELSSLVEPSPCNFRLPKEIANLFNYLFLSSGSFLSVCSPVTAPFILTLYSMGNNNE